MEPTGTGQRIGLLGQVARKGIQMREAGLVAVIIAMALGLTIYGFFNPVPRRVRVEPTEAGASATFRTVKANAFLNADTLLSLAKDTSFIAIMALGATLVIITAGIDLSVGSIYALAAVAGAAVFRTMGPAGPWSEIPAISALPIGIAVCLCVGAACGLANGVMITSLQVHPFVITLGAMAIYRGMAFVTTGGQSIVQFPPELQALIRWDIGPSFGLAGLYPVPLVIMFAAVLVAHVFMRRTVSGMEIYAVGGNLEAARYSGLRVNRLLILVYTLAGAAAGLAALIMLGYYGSADSGAGAGYELDVIAAAVVGGAALTGGRGTAFGALLGALLIKMIDVAITIMKLEQNYSRPVLGAVIILAVFLDHISQRMTQRRLKAEVNAELGDVEI